MLLPDADADDQGGVDPVGNDSGHSRAPQPQLRHSQFTINQAPVEKGVDADRDAGCDQRHPHILHTAAGHAADGGKGQRHRAPADRAQILGPGCPDSFFIGEHAHHLIGEASRQHHIDQSDQQTQGQAETVGTTDLPPLPRSPVLGNEHGTAGTKAEGDHLDQRGPFSPDAHSGGGNIPQPGHHGGVHQAGAGGKHILQGNGDGQDQHTAVKAGDGMLGTDHRRLL